jgi:hypothetical protein
VRELAVRVGHRVGCPEAFVGAGAEFVAGDHGSRQSKNEANRLPLKRAGAHSAEPAESEASKSEPAGARVWSPAISRIVRVKVVPHCTQPWVISSRPFDSTPLAPGAGATAVITIRCPQRGQGRRKVGRRDKVIFRYCMESPRFRYPTPRLFPAPFTKVSTNIVRCTIFMHRTLGMVAVPASKAQTELTHCSVFVLINFMENWAFKIVKLDDQHDHVIALVENFVICKAAFEKALFVYPNDHLEMRQGARIVLKSKEEPSLDVGSE